MHLWMDIWKLLSPAWSVWPAHIQPFFLTIVLPGILRVFNPVHQWHIDLQILVIFPNSRTTDSLDSGIVSPSLMHMNVRRNACATRLSLYQLLAEICVCEIHLLTHQLHRYARVSYYAVIKSSGQTTWPFNSNVRAYVTFLAQFGCLGNQWI